MKKIFLLFITLATILFMPNFMSCAEVSQVRVIYSIAHVYSTDDITTSQIISTFNYDDVLTVISTSTGTDGYEYYLIQLDNVQDYTQGYVFKSQVLDASVVSPQKQLDANASIKAECNVYALDGKNYIESQTKLSAGTQIKILSGYNQANEYTQIQYTNDQGKIVTAYIKTSAIAVNGVSRAFIGAIIIIVTTVSLVLVIFGIGKKKKPHKKLK